MTLRAYFVPDSLHYFSDGQPENQPDWIILQEVFSFKTWRNQDLGNHTANYSDKHTSDHKPGREKKHRLHNRAVRMASFRLVLSAVFSASASVPYSYKRKATRVNNLNAGRSEQYNFTWRFLFKIYISLPNSFIRSFGLYRPRLCLSFTSVASTPHHPPQRTPTRSSNRAHMKRPLESKDVLKAETIKKNIVKPVERGRVGKATHLLVS